MRSYYVLHDVENMRIGFVPANAEAAPLNPEYAAAIIFVILLLVCLLVAACIACYCVYKCR